MDGRYEVAYREAVRGVDEQTQVLEQLRGRAGTLFSAAGVVTGILGLAVDDVTITSRGDKTAVAAATLAFVVLTAATLKAWWPLRGEFRMDPRLIVRDFIEGDEPLDGDDMYRELALRYGANADRIGKKLKRRLRWHRAALLAFAVLIASLVALILEVE